MDKFEQACKQEFMQGFKKVVIENKDVTEGELEDLAEYLYAIATKRITKEQI